MGIPAVNRARRAGQFGQEVGGSAMDPSAVPALTVAAVARRLGVAPATLRTWDRRYSLGPSGHTAGAHRRYTPSDVERLTLMRRLTLDGVPPAEAARVALAHEGADAPVRLPSDAAPSDFPASHPPPSDPLPSDSLATVTALEPSPVAAVRPPPAGGGRVLALPHGSAASRGLARAAMALDAYACSILVSRALEESGVVRTWEELLLPVLIGVGERWAETGEGVEVEHLLSEVVMASLRQHQPEVPAPLNGRPVLLACAEDEQHSLPLHVLAAALADRRVSSRLLGPRVPTRALVDAVRRSGPSVVFVWSQLEATADPTAIEALPVQRPPATIVLGGPGWQVVTAGRHVERVGDLPHAVDLVVGAVTASRL
jgi:DNA-binding transcriptional MerR regulator